MFETLEVKDPREASKRFKEALEKERTRHAEKLAKLEKEFTKKQEEHEMALSRRDIRIDELKSKVEEAQGSLEEGVTKSQYEKERKAHKANVAQWEKVFQSNEEKWKGTQAKLVSITNQLTINPITDPSASKRLSTRSKPMSKSAENLRENGWKLRRSL